MTFKDPDIFTRCFSRAKEIKAVRLQLSNVIEVHNWCGGDPMADVAYSLVMYGYI